MAPGRLAVVRVAALLPFADALARQAALAAQRARDAVPDTLLLCEARPFTGSWPRVQAARLMCSP